jgi:dihydroorotase
MTITPHHDTIFTDARICVPGIGFVHETALAVKDGVISAISSDLALDDAHQVIDVGGNILTAGLIDMHTHVYHKANMACVDPMIAAIRSGATTIVDAGTAGASSIHGLVDFVIKPCPVRILAFLNISYAGIFGFNPAINVGEATDPRLLHTGLCKEAVTRFREYIVGIKVRIGKGESGDNGDVALARAIEAAEALDLPLMAHIGAPPMELDALLARMRPGDILTHCFRGGLNAPLSDTTGGPRASVIAARDRGVLFDIGHGMGSFSFNSASKMTGGGFLPDTISSDIHQFNIDGPVRDLLHVASKILALGVPFETVIDMMTCNVAKALRRPELGKLEVGSAADLVILATQNGDTTFHDCAGIAFVGKTSLFAKRVFVAGVGVGGSKLDENDPRVMTFL